jgi:hypothetical protein
MLAEIISQKIVEDGAISFRDLKKGNMNINLSGLKFAKQPDSIQFPW